MTTTVTITAHCADHNQVRVEISTDGQPEENFTLQNGETAERVVYGERELKVREEQKS